MEIPSISTQINPQAIGGATSAGKPAHAVGQVGDTFKNMLNQLSETENQSDDLLKKLAAGENVDVHQVMIADAQTDINFRVAMAIRDRLVDTYREVMRMSV